MIGNDIVDLHLASKSRWWTRKRALEKVFTPREKDYLHICPDPHGELWRLWSMKESAHKCYVQKDGQTFYAPSKIECHVLSDTLGKVTICGHEITTATHRHDGVVHSIACSDERIHRTKAIFKTSGLGHKEIQKCCYRQLLASLARQLNKDIDELAIVKNRHGIPLLYEHGTKVDVSISMSHHGRFFAIVYA